MSLFLADVEAFDAGPAGTTAAYSQTGDISVQSQAAGFFWRQFARRGCEAALDGKAGAEPVGTADAGDDRRTATDLVCEAATRLAARQAVVRGAPLELAAVFLAQTWPDADHLSSPTCHLLTALGLRAPAIALGLQEGVAPITALRLVRASVKASRDQPKGKASYYMIACAERLVRPFPLGCGLSPFSDGAAVLLVTDQPAGRIEIVQEYVRSYAGERIDRPWTLSVDTFQKRLVDGAAKAARELLRTVGVRVEQIYAAIPADPNAAISQAIGRGLGIPPAKLREGFGYNRGFLGACELAFRLQSLLLTETVPPGALLLAWSAGLSGCHGSVLFRAH